MATKVTMADPEGYDGEIIDLEIKGLKEIGPGLFRLSGVKLRNIHWPAVAVAMQADGPPIEQSIMDKIADLLWKEEMIRTLADRIGL